MKEVVAHSSLLVANKNKWCSFWPQL